MSEQDHDLTGWNDPLAGRKRSRVDAFMPWSSIKSLMPVGQATGQAEGTTLRGATILRGSCRLYHFPAGQARRSTP